MRKVYVVLLVILISVNAISQTSQIDHWESLFISSSYFNYWSSNQGAVSPDWRTPGFDDTGWNVGMGGIGYGDDDDSTIIDPCSGLFLRISIDIADKSKIAEAILYMDYDDAFVAYLNGTEIARSAGLSDPFPEIDQLSTSQHEVGTREKFDVDPAILQSNLLNGKNTIAIQVHNASTNSSDLSSSAWFLIGSTSTEYLYLPIPEWFTVASTFKSSNLPIFVIETEFGQQIPDEPKVNAYLGIICDYDGQTNFLSAEPNHYSGTIGIERRGNSTQGFPKKPYLFETRDSAGFNFNVSLFGWPAENDWILRASYMDHTFIRNPLAMHMSREMGRWASRCRLVEVVLNGEYMGIYILMEKIKRDNGRLDIAELTVDEITEPVISGGYIYEITGFNNNLGESRYLKYPDYDQAAPEQIEYIKNYDDGFRNVMRSSNYMDEDEGYAAWIDVGSFIDELLVQEAMRNSDAYGWSGYFHKDMEGKINAGPVWDFDQSAGNSSYPDDGVVENWLFSHPWTSNTPFFWPLLFEDPLFRYKVRYRWEMLREGPFQTEKLINYIDSLAFMLKEPQEREFAKWPVLGTNFWRETSGYEQRDTYQKEVDYMKGFLSQRWSWMDNELSQYENPSTSINGLFANSVSVYPNPATEFLIFNLDQPVPGNIFISIYNNLGVLMQSESLPDGLGEHQTFRVTLEGSYNPGMYIYKIQFGNDDPMIGRFIKVD